MEKLIELLNEHRAELLHGNIQNKPMRYSYGSYVFGLSDLTEQNCILLIISKSYGFIKRLVDNDKIDHKIYEDMKFTAIKQGVLVDKKSGSTAQETREIIKNGCIDAFIALLAIQDEPIEFLISILK